MSAIITCDVCNKTLSENETGYQIFIRSINDNEKPEILYCCKDCKKKAFIKSLGYAAENASERAKTEEDTKDETKTAHEQHDLEKKPDAMNISRNYERDDDGTDDGLVDESPENMFVGMKLRDFLMSQSYMYMHKQVVYMDFDGNEIAEFGRWLDHTILYAEVSGDVMTLHLSRDIPQNSLQALSNAFV